MLALHVFDQRLACSRLRDSGGKSFSNKKCEKRAGAGESRARLNFTFNKFPLRILSESLAQANQRSNHNVTLLPYKERVNHYFHCFG